MPQQLLSDSEIFKAAVQLAPARRRAYLDEACAGNEPLRDEVESLLRAHDPAGSFLQSPAAEVTIDRPLTERPGTIIGPYKLREQIGEGGFGVVYVAEQERPVRRKVALKVIRPGMDTKDVIARFEAERQALALMDHPNVARVLDAGATESGRPYFVMELVQGVTITEFCDKNSLRTRERLVLFADVCRAVQHAHQKGIIHRDLKPSNIMVTLHDGQPVAKVIDFGVSKALSQQLTEKSIYTAYGQMIGTPSYMSPEQAEMSGLGIDTRSDIYSLGVLLYELLTGQTPLDARRLRASAYAEILRIIKEEEPPRPSLKISTLGEQATVIAQQRHTDVKQLRRDLTGELDWIVMKCLEKDRSRRYETANGLARDIERYLKDEPVEACPPSTSYRLVKYWRKHRGLLSTAAAFATLLLVGAVISSWLAVRATLAERRVQEALTNEQAARRDAEATKEKLERSSQRVNKALQLANEGTELYYRQNRTAALEKFNAAVEVEASLETIYVYRRMLYRDIGLWDLAAADYAESFRLSTRAQAQTLYEHAQLQLYVGNDSGYRAACQELLRQHGNSNNVDVRMLILRACCNSSQGVLDPTALTRRAERLAAASDKGWHRSAVAQGFLRAGNPARAIEICQMFQDPKMESPGGIHRVNFAIEAMALHALGRDAEAREALSKMEVALNEWTTAMLDGPVGTMPITWTDWLQCLILHREAKTLLSGSPPPEDPRLVSVRQRALLVTQGDAYTYMEAGRQAVARKAWDEAAASFATAIDKMPLSVGFGPGPGGRPFSVEMVQQPEVFDRLVVLRPRYFLWLCRGLVLASRREWREAAIHLVHALKMTDEYNQLTDAEKLRQQIRELSWNPTEDERKAMAERIARGQIVGPITLYELALVRLLAGDEAGYQELCDRIVRDAERSDTPQADVHLSRALSIGSAGTIDTATAIRLAEKAVAAEPKLAWHWYTLGLGQYRAGRHDEAIHALQQSLSVDPAWLGRCQTYTVMAMVCEKLGRHDEARDWLAKAKPALVELEETIGKQKYGFANSNFIGDWLAIQVLLPEADALLGTANRKQP